VRRPSTLDPHQIEISSCQLEAPELAFLLASAEVERLLQRLKNIPTKKIRDIFLLFLGVIVGSTNDVLLQRTSMRELLFDLFLIEPRSVTNITTHKGEL
jgi:hypothetical protein